MSKDWKKFLFFWVQVMTTGSVRSELRSYKKLKILFSFEVRINDKVLIVM